MTIWSSTKRYKVLAAALTVLTVLTAACGSTEGTTVAAPNADGPTVVVTTNILGDVVDELIGDQAEVITILPVGADPHDFQPSPQDVEQMQNADALIVNGGDFEEGLLDLIDSTRDEGVPTYTAIDSVETINFGVAGGHADEEHADEDEEHKDDDHEGVDPHFFTDPSRMADAVEGIGAFLSAEVDGIDTQTLDAAVADYVAELDALDAEITALVEEIPTERRILVTNHEVFGYFADRYGFEVVGAAIPSGTTAGSASAGELAKLAELVEVEGVPAIFADTSSSNELAETLAAEVGGDVEVVELYSESLDESGSEGDTYISMVRANALRINEALT